MFHAPKVPICLWWIWCWTTNDELKQTTYISIHLRRAKDYAKYNEQSAQVGKMWKEYTYIVECSVWCLYFINEEEERKRIKNWHAQNKQAGWLTGWLFVVRSIICRDIRRMNELLYDLWNNENNSRGPLNVYWRRRF